MVYFRVYFCSRFSTFVHYSFLFLTCQEEWLNIVNFIRCAQRCRGDIVFYDKFANLCKEKGVSVSRGALEAGISKSLVTKWKTNQTEIPSSEVLSKLSSYFQIPVSELLDESTSAASRHNSPIIDRAGLKFALFHGRDSVTDAMLDEVLSFAEYVTHREESKKK